jgi:hypothetical protein
MAGGGVSSALGAQGGCLGDSWHNSEGFSQQALTGIAVVRISLPVHAHICGTKAGFFYMGPRWLIYPIPSHPRNAIGGYALSLEDV